MALVVCLGVSDGGFGWGCTMQMRHIAGVGSQEPR